MRSCFWVAIAALCLSTPAVAQSTVNRSTPSEIGNRANGRDYQPTPGEVAPRERAAGVQPSANQEKATNQDLEKLDDSLLRQEGLSTKSVPKLTTGQQ